MQFRDPTAVIVRLIIITILAIIVLGLFSSYLGVDQVASESVITHEMFVICRSDDYIHIRLKPSKKSQSIGWLECGDSVMCDGKEKNGFTHVIGITEYNEGWVYTGYLVDEPPIDSGEAPYYICSNARVACRKSIDGKRRCWANPMETLKVLFYTDEWCLTNKGFVQTRYLDPDPE